MPNKAKAPRNRTTVLSTAERKHYSKLLLSLKQVVDLDDVLGRTIHQDLYQALPYLPPNSVDLLIVDPPYNLTKDFNGRQFNKKSLDDYENWLESWLEQLIPILKPNASLYICGDWQSSAAIHRACQKHFYVRNRITWEREKGRGAKTNWKNCAEDIWFCTVSRNYTFNVDAVKMQHKVHSPYTDLKGKPKDWCENKIGKFRITYPSNLWTDISIPFWSMPENTEHPTQKPEKLLAKLILASSNEGDVIFDPFLGSGTTLVVAKKLNRHYFGIEIDHDYCCLAEKRLDKADDNKHIQGYVGGYFWERNTFAAQSKKIYNTDSSN